jgi:hypothetical protein
MDAMRVNAMTTYNATDYAVAAFESGTRDRADNAVSPRATRL